MEMSHVWQDMEEKIEANSPETNEPVIEVNELLQVRIPGEKESHFSRVNNILGNEIVIAWPTIRGIRMPLRVNQDVELSFVRDATPYAFTGLILTATPDPLPQITVRSNSEVKKVQRREHFRIKCMMPIQIIGNIPDGSDPGLMQPLFIKCVTFDLSAGGLSIRNATRIPEDLLIEVKLKLSDGGPEITIPARVAYSGSVSNNAALYHIGIYFLAVNEWEQARIIRCLYRIQLKSLRI
jgi:c-di-GMP-binding flagellar brake protein YcgR